MGPGRQMPSKLIEIIKCVVRDSLPEPFPIGGASLSDPDWIPITDPPMNTFAAVRRYPSFRAYHDSGNFNVSEVHRNSSLIGRSVWNSHWKLVIPGKTLLADPEEGLKRFIQTVSDIKLHFVTYSYSGN